MLCLLSLSLSLSLFLSLSLSLYLFRCDQILFQSKAISKNKTAEDSLLIKLTANPNMHLLRCSDSCSLWPLSLPQQPRVALFSTKFDRRLDPAAITMASIMPRKKKILRQMLQNTQLVLCFSRHLSWEFTTWIQRVPENEKQNPQVLSIYRAQVSFSHNRTGKGSCRIEKHTS